LAFNNFYVPLLVRFHTRSRFHVVGMDIGTSEICFILMLLIVGALSLRRFLSIRDRELIDRESIARDLEEARQLQQRVLVPENVHSDAYSVQVEYRPALTVGGDFFQTLARPDGSLTLLIGDVSGKGVSAAMLVAVLVGAARARARQTADPAAILEELNTQMIGRAGGHFATCMVAALGADGTLRLANAGHLPPYLNGIEMDVPGSLPLGMTATLEPATIVCALKPGDSLAFMSDGVVEAQSPTGELFGFDRTAAVSTQSAERIAAAAQAFGQEDDITVLTLTFAPALNPAEVQLA
jgi:serine phosphatase RsbU (regulator of sigma subunit)